MSSGELLQESLAWRPGHLPSLDQLGNLRQGGRAHLLPIEVIVGLSAVPEMRQFCCMQEPWLGDHDASLPKIHIGICAMDKKAHSRPMKAIVDRLETYGEFEITYFGDETILDKPIADWPSCDCLLSWHSDGFPLAKVKALLLDGLRHGHPVTTNDSLSASQRCKIHQRGACWT